MDVDGIAYPIIGTTVGDDEMQWRDVGLEGAQRFLGSQILSFKEFSSENFAHAVVEFENGSSLKLKRNFTTDDSEFATLTDN